MLVSMTPNDEVKTIHASLNDGSLRKWEFEPYTENGKIELTDQDYAKIQSIKGNTVKFNQLLVNINTNDYENFVSIENGVAKLNFSGQSSPGTNRFYPKLAKRVQAISGHKYYQSIEIMLTNSSSIYRIGFNAGSLTYLIPNTAIINSYQKLSNILTAPNSQIVDSTIRDNSGTTGLYDAYVKNWMIIDLTLIFGADNEPSSVSDFETWLSNNIGLLPYYDYTPGTLISFNGTGLKTVGKNQLPITVENIKALNPSYNWNGNVCTWVGVSITLLTDENNNVIGLQTSGTATNNLYFILGDNFDNLLGKSLTLSGCPSNGSNTTYQIMYYIYNGSANAQDFGNGVTFTPTNNSIVQIVIRNGINTNGLVFKPMLRFADTDNTYKSYTESTLSLPISTYFPTGMKSAGNVYDELSDKAYTRVGSVDLGTLNWERSNVYGMYTTGLASLIKAPSTNAEVANIKCPTRETYSFNAIYYSGLSGIAINTSGTVGYSTTETDPATFKQAMSGQYLYYELATPIETDIDLDLTYPIWNNGTEQILPVNGSTPTTSPMVATIEYPDRTEDVNFLYKQTTFDSAIPQFSLVCKNQELPMTLEDGKLICECDSSITNESGFFDCKVKMQDLDSVAYSQKIQLHVERGIND